MKALTLLLGAMAFPIGIASAQTPATVNGAVPYIALSPSSGGTGVPGSAGPNTTWFIDTTNRLVVLCAQSTETRSNGAPDFTCTARPAPLAVLNGAAAAAGSTGGSTGTATSTTNSALANPFR